MKKNPEIFLKHILENISDTEKITKGMNKPEFLKSMLHQKAAIRCLEVIGEAVKKLPALIKNKYPEIEWKKIAGMRDVLIHDYFGVDNNLVWSIIKKDLPTLKNQIKTFFLL